MKESANDRNDFLLKEPRLRKCRCRWKPRKHRWEDSPRFFRMEYAAAAAHAPVHLLPRAFTRPRLSSLPRPFSRFSSFPPASSQQAWRSRTTAAAPHDGHLPLLVRCVRPVQLHGRITCGRAGAASVMMRRRSIAG
jgi:hypothetical protein